MTFVLLASKTCISCCQVTNSKDIEFIAINIGRAKCHLPMAIVNQSI